MTNTIVVGVEDSEHSKDAIALARRLAQHSTGDVVVACACGSGGGLEREAELTAQRMGRRLEDIDAARIRTCAVATSSLTRALHDLADAESAAIVIIGSSHVGELGQMVPNRIGTRLLHDAPCAIAVAPDGYRARRSEPIRRIGVAFDGTAESRAAVGAALAAVWAFGAELEVITVVSARIFATPTMMAGPGYISAETHFGRAAREAREALDALAAGLSPELVVEGTILDGRPAHQLALRSKRLDILVVGSHGRGLLHAALGGGVSGRVLRDAQCPVIAVPPGAGAPFGALFGAVTSP
jgi:nucleotide-binding universal stress UspA family protein